MRALSRLLGLLFVNLLMLTGCPAIGPLDPGGSGAVNNDVIGEVQAIDTRNREIEIRTDTGRRIVVRYRSEERRVGKECRL